MTNLLYTVLPCLDGETRGWFTHSN